MKKATTNSSKIKAIQNKNTKLKIIVIASVSINIVLLIVLGFYIFKVNSANNDNGMASKQNNSLVGIYRGDGTYKECMPGIVCRTGWSNNSYMQLNEDGTCYTNMSFFIGTGVDESRCKWYIDDDVERHIMFVFPDLSGIYHTGMGDEAKRGGNYEEDGSLVILNAYLRKEQ